MAFSTGAVRLLRQMQAHPLNFLTDTQANTRQSARNELWEEQLISPSSNQGVSGYVLTRKGREWKQEDNSPASKQSGVVKRSRRNGKAKRPASHGAA